MLDSEWGDASPDFLRVSRWLDESFKERRFVRKRLSGPVERKPLVPIPQPRLPRPGRDGPVPASETGVLHSSDFYLVHLLKGADTDGRIMRPDAYAVLVGLGKTEDSACTFVSDMKRKKKMTEPETGVLQIMVRPSKVLEHEPRHGYMREARNAAILWEGVDEKNTLTSKKAIELLVAAGRSMCAAKHIVYELCARGWADHPEHRKTRMLRRPDPSLLT